MGGSIASYYAGSFPERVHKLALLEGLGPPESKEAMPARVATWLGAWKKVRERSPKSYASVEEAAARIAEHDPLVSAEMARFLADKGTTPALGGRIRFKHDPLARDAGAVRLLAGGGRAVLAPGTLPDACWWPARSR